MLIAIPCRKIALAVLGLALLVGIPSANAQDAMSSQWKPIQGNATDIAVGTDGTVAAIGKQGDVYLFNHADENWEPIGKSMSRIAVGPDGVIWAVDRNGTVRRFGGASWNAVGEGATDIALGQNGTVYVVTNTKSLAAYDPALRQWQAIEGNAVRIAVDAEGLPWGITEKGTVARRLDDAWIGVIGQALDIATDASGRVLMLGEDKRLYEWQNASATWIPVTGAPSGNVVAAGGGQIWISNAQGQIFATGITDALRNKSAGITTSGGGGGSVESEEVIDNSAYVFERVPDDTVLADLSIGRDGSIYGLETDKTLKRWSNFEQRFYDFPGFVNQVAVQNDGFPLAIGTQGNLVKHDGEAWRLVILNLLLSDLSIAGQDNDVRVISQANQAAQLSGDYQTYSLLPKQGTQIANHPREGYWVIDGANRLFQCPDNGMPCEQQPITATDIAIGPGGTVFIVDTRSTLRRYNPQTESFDIIRQGDTSKVAVGPQDRPWIINNDGLVLQAGYFNREEAFDRRIAIRTTVTAQVTQTLTTFVTATNTTTGGNDDDTDDGSEEEGDTDDEGDNGGITIVQNINFMPVAVPTTTARYGNVGTGLRDVTSGVGDAVIVTGFASPCQSGTGKNWIYNPSTRQFNFMDYLNRVNLLSGIAGRTPPVTDITGDNPPGTVQPDISAFYGVWSRFCEEVDLLTYVEDVFESATAQSTNNYDDAAFFSPEVSGLESDVDVAKDDTVVFVSTRRHLEYFTPSNVDGTATEREDLQFLRVGMGANKDDLWVVDTSNNVYEYDPLTDSFLLRSVLATDRAQDVGVGHNGTVFIVTTAGELKKWDALSQIFIGTNKSNVTRVAVSSNGKPIVGDFPNSQIVYFGQ